MHEDKHCRRSVGTWQWRCKGKISQNDSAPGARQIWPPASFSWSINKSAASSGIMEIFISQTGNRHVTPLRQSKRLFSSSLTRSRPIIIAARRNFRRSHQHRNHRIPALRWPANWSPRAPILLRRVRLVIGRRWWRGGWRPRWRTCLPRGSSGCCFGRSPRCCRNPGCPPRLLGRERTENENWVFICKPYAC